MNKMPEQSAGAGQWLFALCNAFRIVDLRGYAYQ